MSLKKKKKQKTSISYRESSNGGRVVRGRGARARKNHEKLNKVKVLN